MWPNSVECVIECVVLAELIIYVGAMRCPCRVRDALKGVGVLLAHDCVVDLV